MTHTDTGRDELMMVEDGELSPYARVDRRQDRKSAAIRPVAVVEEPAEDTNTPITTRAGED
jgi:hypothetical protein